MYVKIKLLYNIQDFTDTVQQKQCMLIHLIRNIKF